MSKQVNISPHEAADRLAIRNWLRHTRIARTVVTRKARCRYDDTFVKAGGAWSFAERLLYVDWIEERAL